MVYSIIFMVIMSLIGIASLAYIVKRIFWLLIEKDEELRYRSLKVGDEVLKSDGNQNHDDDDNQIVEERDDLKKLLLSDKAFKADHVDPKGSFSSNQSYKNRNQMF